MKPLPAFGPDVQCFDVEAIPVTIGKVPDVDLYFAAWDTDPPRRFPTDSVGRNGGPVSRKDFPAFVAEVRAVRQLPQPRDSGIKFNMARWAERRLWQRRESS